MPKRAMLPEYPDYTGIPKSDYKLLVQKSNPLRTLSETELTLPELKILDAYLSKIDSHDPEKRYVRFGKGELEHALGVDRIRKDELSKRLKNLFQAVTIRDNNKRDGFTTIALFEKAEAFQDDNGLWQVDLACTPSAMEYIFNVETMGYLSYMLKNIIELTSRYSYVLYLYLESRRKGRQGNSWTISLEELKSMLRCTADSYVEYKRFNDLVLKKCYKELNEKTALRFSYEPIRKGRRVVEVRFTVEASEMLPDEYFPEQQVWNESDKVPESFDLIDDLDEDEQWIAVYGSEQLAILADGCKYEFNKLQMEQIQSVLLRIHIAKDSTTNDVTWGRRAYLREKYAALNNESLKKEQQGEKPIKNRFKYFLGMLEKDTFQPTAYTE